jgi:hypothetical protein
MKRRQSSSNRAHAQQQGTQLPIPLVTPGNLDIEAMALEAKNLFGLNTEEALEFAVREALVGMEEYSIRRMNRGRNTGFDSINLRRSRLLALLFMLHTGKMTL